MLSDIGLIAGNNVISYIYSNDSLHMVGNVTKTTLQIHM